MTQEKLLNLIKKSSMDKEVKKSLLQDLEDKGFTDEVKENLLAAFKKHLTGMEEEIGKTDEELKGVAKATAPAVYGLFQKEEGEERDRMAAAIARRMIDEAMEDFKDNMRALEDVLDAVEVALSEHQAHALAK
jgi:hypothetical protein